MECNEFLERANGKCRTRVFSAVDYDDFRTALVSAVSAAIKREPYYVEWDAGGVANSYKYATSTARCGLYTTPSGHIVPVVDRPAARRKGASCIYNGGERSYLKWFREVCNADA